MKPKHFLKIIIFFFVFAVLVFASAKLFCVANERDALGVYGFYKEPEDSLDVVMIGASEMYTDFYSPLAYEMSGFTSYSLSTSTMPASLYKYAAEIAIERQHPDLLVFETYGFCYENQLDETSLRKFIDALPSSEIKTRIIDELVPEERKESFRNPFSKYHSSWDRFSDLVDVLVDKAAISSRGYSITKNFATTPFCQQYYEYNDSYSISEQGFYYLEKLLEYLKTANIENVLFVRYPEMVNYETDDSYFEMINMIEDAGFDFVNLYSAASDIGLDASHDFYNMTHMNVFGAEKFTEFFGEYIMYMYDINTEHSEKVTKEWEECSSYNDDILSRLKDLTDKDINGFLYTQRDFLN